ncbi:MAG: DUF5698 domain-containing protein [Myxococcota bacterium]|jgi:uncharacterized protein YebE (UPF0316 family)|nr:DUF5698 domain-containing protein [Myxococcota bacterium]
MEELFTDNLFIAAALIFALRIIDVSLGTIRTISIVNGRITLAVLLGFFEVLIWITAISQVMVGVTKSPVLLVAYAGGFASGNGVGILLEQRLAMGTQLLKLFTRKGEIAADVLRDAGQAVTSVRGEGRDGPVEILHVVTPRRLTRDLIELAQKVDPELFYVIEPVAGWSRKLPISNPTGWRAVAKKK